MKPDQQPDPKLDAKSLSRLIAEADGPLAWRDLVVALDLSTSAERKKLSSVLKGMVRGGELDQDHRGAYHLAGSGGTRRGLIESSGMSLTFLGLPLERQKRQLLRAGDEVSARVVGETVHVLEVLARSNRPLVGIVRGHGRYPHVESLSPDYRGRVSLENPEEATLEGETVAVAVVGEDRRGLVGRIVEHLGGDGGVAQAVVTMIEAYGIPTEWAEGVEAQLERLPGKVYAGRHPTRRNLADTPLVTIDGVTARDFDDAVFAEPVSSGWRLIVAIADVAHYVKRGSALDVSARERGNSVYLPDRVVPMLPEELSNGLCSLNPKVARLAMVCEMTVARSGEVTGFDFYEAVIRSWQRLTYERVQEFLDDGVLDVEPAVCHSLGELKQVYEALRDAREARGALDFDTHEASLEIADNHIRAIHPVHRLTAHKLIEEAMIAANVCAAQFIETRLGEHKGMYRVHEPPAEEKLDLLTQALAMAGVRLRQGQLTPSGLKSAMDQLESRENRWLYEMLVLRSLMQAVYTPENKGHFGLALERYMHFTSPIRRYADLVVHRIIKAILTGQQTPYGTEELLEIGAHISATERQAESVGWAVDAWLKCEYVADRVGETFEGVVMGVTDFGLFVELKGFYVQGLLHVSELGSDYFQYQPQSLSLVGERSGRRFTLGDEFPVVLVDAIPEQGRLDLRLEPGRATGAGGDGHPGRKKGRKGRRARDAKDRRR
ncbi:MAG: ribonuclease R [Pseudomonadales bacterium]